MRKLLLAIIGTATAIFFAERMRRGRRAMPAADLSSLDVGSGTSASPSTDARRSGGWQGHSSASLNAVELPAADAARSQHEQPMQNSEQTVDPAHTAHR